MIPYSRQTVEKDDIDAVIKVLQSDWLTTGPNVTQFESALAKYVGARFAVSFTSGTAALQAAYFAAGIGKGDEIITTALTFAATGNAAIWQGAKVVFADVDPVTGNIDPREVEKKITKRTKAIVPVDYSGLPADLDALKKIARAHKLLIIEDGAHALGATYKGKKIGGIADMTMLSFHPVKSITTGEGGAITTNNKQFAERLRMFGTHGITKDSRRFVNKSPGDWYHEMQELGLNCRLTDIQAALGTSQLAKLDRFIEARRKIVARYQKELADVEGLTLPHDTLKERSAWHLFPIRIKNEELRPEIFKNLRTAGIGVQVHYIPVYWHPYYQKLGYKKGLCPNAEKFYLGEISLPVYPALSTKDQTFVIEEVKKNFS